jgi:mycobactin peptide synthetase MbtE
MSPDAVFCVFFTSGTTGEPKGVLATHRAVAGLLQPGGSVPVRLSRSTVMSVAAPTAWDMFAFELWGPLLNGGTCLLAEDDHLTPGQLRENVARHGQDTVWLTSSLFSLFVEEDPGAFTGLTQVVTGGERLSPEHAREFLRAHPRIRLVNDYGPAENCIVSTMHEVTLEDCDRPTGIPIGLPERATTVWLLDGERTCRPGELGEICLEGPRVSPGYLGDPELTRRAFVTIELAGQPRRIYRTGDLGWRDERGLYHFHGRADRQVKVRGHRIEPAEIERHVTAHPAIARCMVVPLTDPEGTVTELIACHQARDTVTATELREFLRGRLPGYLIPEHWLPVDRIPVLGNGKADIEALRRRAKRASAGDLTRDSVSVVPAGPLLAEVQNIVIESTGLEIALPDTPLFEAGVNSLQLIRVCVRASRRWRVRIEPAEFFRRPTVRHLARLVSQASVGSTGRDEGIGHGHLLNSVQFAILLTDATDPAHQGAWNCTLAWRIEGAVDERALRRAIGVVHRRHPMLHARYPVLPPFLSAVIDPPSSPEFTTLERDGEDQAWAGLDEALHLPFRLDRGPVWRAVLARVTSSDTTLLGVAVNHVAFDDWSEHVLARDLAAAYASQLSGAPGDRGWFAEPLPWPVENPAADARLAEQRQILAAELADAPPLTFPAPTVPPLPGSRSGRIAHALDAAQIARCATTARQYATTPFVVGVAAYAAAVSTLTGMTDFPVAVPVAQRHAKSEDAIGCLLNLLCLRLRLPDTSGDPRSTIPAAKRAVRQALLAQDVPFPEAVSLLRPRAGTVAPAVPYLFVLQQDVTPVLNLPGCQTGLRRLPQHFTGFDFQLEWRLRGGHDGEVVVTYRPGAVDETFASTLTGAFTTFVTAVPAEPSAPSSDAV